jgi:hypothetical protein
MKASACDLLLESVRAYEVIANGAAASPLARLLQRQSSSWKAYEPGGEVTPHSALRQVAAA